VFFTLSAFLLTLTLGCGGKTGETVVYGKVTLNGQAVDGSVTFIGSDKKESASPIAPDGKYRIINPPLGAVRIVVKGNPKGAGMKELPKGPGEAPNATGGGSGVPPPKKYENPENGLTYEVKAGEQEHNIELTP